jgi:hypothetical protein
MTDTVNNIRFYTILGGFAMYKTLIFVLILGLTLFLGACNTPGGPGSEEGEATTVVYNWVDTATDKGYRPESLSGSGWKGLVMELPKDCSDITGTQGDLTLYSEIVLDAKIYANNDSTTPITQANDVAQFKLIRTQGGWDDAILTKQNMTLNGASSALVPAEASGKPQYLLIQVNDSKAGSIELRSLTIKLKTGLPAFEVLTFGQSASHVSVSNNKITFTGAEFDNHAALYAFPSGFPTGNGLNGKKLVFNFKIESTNTTDEHQIHIQAAGKKSGEEGINGFNGLNPGDTNNNRGQLYVTLDDANGQYEQTYDGTTKVGVFKIPFDKLLAAAQVEGSDDNKGIQGPFTLCAVRIVNDGKPYQGATRAKSFSVTFNSITVE